MTGSTRAETIIIELKRNAERKEIVESTFACINTFRWNGLVLKTSAQKS